MGDAFGTPGPVDAELRNAVVADADDVARLLSELGYPCDTAEAAERISAILANDRQALVLARCHGKVCGLVALDFMYYLPLGTSTCRVTALVVNADAQRHGIGRQLLRDAERRARLGGAARIELTSGSQRTEAHAFYQRLGFEKTSKRFALRLP